MVCPICGAEHAACGGPAVLRYDPTDLNPMSIVDTNPPSSKTMWRNDTGRRLYLDADGQLVQEGSDKEPVKFLVGETGEIPLDQAKRLGLVKDEGAEPAPAAEAPAKETESAKLKKVTAERDEAVRRAEAAEKELEGLKSQRANGDPKEGEDGIGGNPPVFDIPGLPHQAVDALKAANLWSAEALNAKTDEELTALAGVGDASVEKIRKALEG